VKVQPELDFAGQGSQPLAFIRTYASAFQVRPKDGFGNLWMHNWQKRIERNLPGTSSTAIALRGDGATVSFISSSGGWLAPFSVRDKLLEIRTGTVLTGWQYVNAATDEVESYDASGKLLSIKARNGWVTSLTYSDAATPFAVAPRAGLLLAVQNQFGVRLDFTYDAQGRIAAVVTPSGATIRYTYDANWMLSSVTWPDGTVRGYHYEDPRFAGALTGVTDEKGIRFATFVYDSFGRAAAEEHANGVDKLQLGYVSNRSQTTVTPSDSIARLFSFEVKNNVVRSTTVSAACPECGNPARSTAYDASGNTSSRVDFDNRETRYTYDASGRETQRIEGYGTADAKTTTTEWHPTWNLPLRVTRPGQIDTFSYDTAGQLLSYAWYASDDPNGSKGLQAVSTGAESSTVWTYNSQGLVEKATDTLNGVAVGEWTFSYDSAGQLLTLTNDYGRVGNVVSRDAGGRITEAVNTDGQHLLMQYDAMGRLTSRDVDGVVTTYTYNEIGLLTAVQGATNVMFEYDAAHRLTAYLLPEGQTMQVSDISNPFVIASSMSSNSTKAAPQESLWVRVWSTIKRWLGFLIGDANAQARWQRTPVSPIGPSQSRGFPSSSIDADILEQGTGSRQWPDPGVILATWTTQVIEKGIQAAKEAMCGSSEPCPPCRTVTGKIIALGTIGHRPLDTPPPGKPQHGIDGPHYNLFKANQAPRNSPKACWCFWQPIGAVRPEDLPANAIPVEHFSN